MFYLEYIVKNLKKGGKMLVIVQVYGHKLHKTLIKN